MASNSAQAYRGKRGLELIEEAVHGLRVCPLRVLALYYVGTLPFVLGFLFFWSDMSRSSFALERSVGASFVMMALYFWMKTWQALFCRGILAELTPDSEIVRRSAGQWIRYGVAQAFIQAVAIPLQLLSLVLLVPAAWVFAFFQNITVFAFTQDFGDKPTRGLVRLALRQSNYLPRQNHAVMLLGMMFAVFLWMNVYTVLLSLPFLLKRFTGIESVFTTSPAAAILNTTFFAVSVAIAFLCLSPLVKILYTLRCYYGVSTTTGADLLRRLEFLRVRRAAVVAAVLFCAFAWEARGQEGEAGETGAAVEEVRLEMGELDEAIDAVIARREYSWRMPRERSDAISDGVVARFFRDAVDKTVDFFGSIIRKIDKFFGRDRRAAKDADPSEMDWAMALRGLTYALAGIVLVLVIALAWRAYRRRDRLEAEVDDAGALRAAVDLESEEIVASQLPEDEWMALAREQMEKGDFRLAVRALFLASLACLGEKQLVRVEPSKSNRDYQRELRMRARSETEMLQAFSDNVGIFERAWYGLHGVSEEVVNHFLSNYRRITSYGIAS